jgi:sigma-54 dependent transcriptional regulator, flagellar regulatory protein
MAGAVIVIEPDLKWREHVRTVLEFLEYEAVPVASLLELRALGNWPTPLNAVLIGRCASDEACIEVLQYIREKDAGVPILLLAEKSRQAAVVPEIAGEVNAMLDLPLKQAQLVGLLNEAQGASHPGTSASRRALELFRSLVGDSAGIARVRRMIEQVASSDANVLILGESGTGKEVVARKLHYFSARRDKPFVPINCGAIPSELLESELFGHEKGAFTGAISTRQGRFEMAEGGTLFLDEIGDMSLHMQVKLLRVLQERMFERVGSNRSIRADVRIIAATHRNLEELISENKFREDLFYRLNVFPIEMPPLRERREDIALLIEELILRFKNEKRVSVRLTQTALDALSQYSWPGNVRELANLIERLAILNPNGLVDVQDLPAKYTANIKFSAPVTELNAAPDMAIHPSSLPRLPRDGLDIKEHLNNLEYTLIKQALDEAGGVVAHAAERLHLRRTTLVEKLRKYGLARTEEVSGF